jgi:predicted acyl esterase
MVANDVFRGRFRTSFEKPVALVPNRVDEFAIDLHQQNYRFLKGHRIRVQVQSTWFPLIDRNPQTFVPNIFAARNRFSRCDTTCVPLATRRVVHRLPVLRPTVVPWGFSRG